MACRVLLATSLDPQYPEENMTNGSEQSFWISTGMFPQEVVVEVSNRANLVRIASRGKGCFIFYGGNLEMWWDSGKYFHSSPSGIRELRLETSTDETDYPVNFVARDTLMLEENGR